jgi:hypothetical protein
MRTSPIAVAVVLAGIATVLLPLAAHAQRGEKENPGGRPAKQVCPHYPRFNVHGRILARVAGSDKVTIDTGANQWLEKDNLFEVLVRGTLARKSWIRVDQVKIDFARATILSEIDGHDPIAAEDRIRNPFVRRELERGPSFAFLGKRFGPWDQAQTRRMIELAGAEVHSRAQPLTRYFVFDLSLRKEDMTVQDDEQFGLIKLFRIDGMAFEHLALFLRDRLSLKERPIRASVEGVNHELNTLMLSLTTSRRPRKGMRFKIYRNDRILGDVRVEVVHRGFCYTTILWIAPGARLRRLDRAVCDTLDEESAALLQRLDLPPLTKKKPARPDGEPTRPPSEKDREIKRKRERK